jgi:hypothetical protein
MLLAVYCTAPFENRASAKYIIERNMRREEHGEIVKKEEAPRSGPLSIHLR